MGGCDDAGAGVFRDEVRLLNSILLYNVPHRESFGALIALYIFFTGLSAGSFFLSTLSYGFGLRRFRPLSKPALFTASAMLLAAPLFLLAHVGQPLRSWHLFVFLNPGSPITWGSFLLTTYPVFCLLYLVCIFTGRERAARVSGLVGIPFAVCVHAYTGFILSFCAARPLWNSSMLPLLFLISAVVSGTAFMILVYACWCRLRGQGIDASSQNGRLLLSLARILGWVLLVDLVLTAVEILVASVSDQESRLAVSQLVRGDLALPFLGVEVVLGKIVPLVLLFWPGLRKTSVVLLASALIVAGILLMRLDLVRVGELLPLL